MINDIYINIYPSVGIVLFYGLWFTISLFPSKLLNFGQKREIQKARWQLQIHVYIWSPLIHDRKKILLSYCKLSFIYFVLWLCINERNAEIKTTGFLPLVACLTFGIIQDISGLRLMTYRSCWAKNLNCQHMGAIR